MKNNPTKVGYVLNQFGQRIDFYEHPLKGDCSPVIGVYEKEKKAFDTGFYGTEDFFPESDYNPIVINNQAEFAFKLI